MKAARVHEAGKIVIEEVPVPVLRETDVLIQVHRTGICGTDVGVLHGYIPAKLPVTLGHEFSGTIAKLGKPGLGGLREGNAVAASGGWGCGVCELCQKGLDPFCKERVSLGRNTDGCMAEFVKVDYRVVYPLPSNVSLDEGQNLVNLACVVRGAQKIQSFFGKTVAVFGPGNMGLLMLQLARMAGALQTVMVGTRDFRLELAKRFGANHVVNLRRGNPVQRILEWYPGGVDIVAEATGIASSLPDCFEVLKGQGALVSLGIFSGKIKDFDPSFLYYKEPTIYGSKGAHGAYGMALELLGAKKFEILPMITHRFPLEETAKGFKTFEDKVENALRILIQPTP